MNSNGEGNVATNRKRPSLKHKGVSAFLGQHENIAAGGGLFGFGCAPSLCGNDDDKAA